MKRLTDFPIVRYDGEIPIYRIPLARARKNPDAIKAVDPNDDLDLSTGQRHPIIVRSDGTIIDGARRVAALRKLAGRCEVDAVIVDSEGAAANANRLRKRVMPKWGVRVAAIDRVTRKGLEVGTHFIYREDELGKYDTALELEQAYEAQANDPAYESVHKVIGIEGPFN
jgi:hypothetical protein